MNNNLNQSPCLVAAYAQGACNGGQFTVNPLAPDTHYTGPDVTMANPCQCSTVVYSLMSACAACQNRNIETWSAWDVNCTQVYLMQFPDQVPSATSIPAWAYLDVVTNDTFSAAVAQADVSPPAPPTDTSQPPTTVLNTATPTASVFGGISQAKKSNAGAIAGGVVGGLACLGITASIVAFFMSRRRTQIATSTAYSTFNTPHTNAHRSSHRSSAPLNSAPPSSAHPNSAPLNSAPPSSAHPNSAPPSSPPPSSPPPSSPPPMSQHSSTNQQAPRFYDPSNPSIYPTSPTSPPPHYELYQ